MRAPIHPVFGEGICDSPVGKKTMSVGQRLKLAFATRRQRRALMALDDRMLADIGLSRSMAYREASRRFLDTPDGGN